IFPPRSGCRLRRGGRCRQSARLQRRKLMIEVSPCQAIAPAPARGKLLHKRRLEVAPRRLVDQADEPARKGDVVARLDAVQVLKEEATARVHRLAPVLRLQQLLGTATGDLAERDLIAAPMPRPKLLGAKPTVMQTNIRVACCPRVAQRLATDAP